MEIVNSFQRFGILLPGRVVASFQKVTLLNLIINKWMQLLLTLWIVRLGLGYLALIIVLLRMHQTTPQRNSILLFAIVKCRFKWIALLIYNLHLPTGFLTRIVISYQWYLLAVFCILLVSRVVVEFLQEVIFKLLLSVFELFFAFFCVSVLDEILDVCDISGAVNAHVKGFFGLEGATCRPFLIARHHHPLFVIVVPLRYWLSFLAAFV